MRQWTACDGIEVEPEGVEQAAGRQLTRRISTSMTDRLCRCLWRFVVPDPPSVSGSQWGQHQLLLSELMREAAICSHALTSACLERIQINIPSRQNSQKLLDQNYLSCNVFSIPDCVFLAIGIFTFLIQPFTLRISIEMLRSLIYRVPILTVDKFTADRLENFELHKCFWQLFY